MLVHLRSMYAQHKPGIEHLNRLPVEEIRTNFHVLKYSMYMLHSAYAENLSF